MKVLSNAVKVRVMISTGEKFLTRIISPIRNQMKRKKRTFYISIVVDLN